MNNNRKKKRRSAGFIQKVAQAQKLVEQFEPRMFLSATPFTPGDLVVYRVGTGASLAGGATVVFLDEYSTTGSLVQSIPLSSTGSTALTATGTSLTEGQLTLSPDGSTIALTGYNVTANGTTQGSDNATVALVRASAIPTYYVLPGASVVNSNNIRTATVDGNKLYISGAAAYVDFSSLSLLTSGGALNAAPTRLNSTVKNVQELQIFNGQLYFSTQKQSGYAISSDSIASLGTGEPTASSATPSGVADTSTNSSSFFFEHLGGGTGAPNVLYVADTAAGIEKYSLISGNWTAAGTVAISGGAYGITGTVDTSGDVHIFATNAGGIFSATDVSGQTGTFTGGTTQIVAAQFGTAIDGIVLAPDDGVGAITGLGGTLNLIQGQPAILTASAAGFTDVSNLNGGKLIVAGGLANDSLAIRPADAISISGTTVSYSGVQIGTLAGGNGTTPLTVSFNSVGTTPVTAAEVQALIDQISFSSATASAVGSRTLSLQIIEHSGASNTPATQIVSVTAPAVNAPLMNSLPGLNIAENAGTQSLSLTGILHNGGSGTITVTAVSDNPTLIANTGAGAAVVNYDSPASTGTVTFTPTTGVTGTANIVMTVSDNAGSSISVLPVAVIGAPFNVNPGPLNVVRNRSITFSATSGEAVSVADFAVGSSTVQVSLSVNDGNLSLSTTAGLTFTSGGNGQTGFTMIGTLASINAALSGLIYMPAIGYVGPDSLQMVSSDLGHTALDYVQSDTSSISLSVVAGPPTVLLNEIESNEPGTDDNRFQYIELIGTPGASLSNVYFVAFGGETGNVGIAQIVVSLAGYSIGSDGLVVIQSAAGVGQSIPAATTLVPNPAYFTVTGGFPNGSLSFYLYDSPNTGFVAGTNYDANADGTLDHLPAGAAAIDNVAIPDTNNPGDITYGSVQVTEIATLNKGTVDAVTRFPNTTATTSSAWFGGELNDTNNLDYQLAYDPTRESANEPANASLSPGEPNYPEAPVFNASSYWFTIPKTSAAGTLVGSVSATPGENDTVTYSLSGTGGSNFTISSSGGTIIVASGAALSGTTYNLTVSARDNQNSDITTAPLAIAVTLISTSTEISSSGPASYGQAVTLTAKVTPVSNNGETGSVQFFSNGIALGNPTALVDGAATLTTSSLNAGTDSMTAVYSGDGNFAASISPPLDQTITPVPLNLMGPAFYLKLDGGGVHLDVWNAATATGVFSQQVLLSNVLSVSVQGTTGSDFLAVDFSAGDPLPSAGLTDTGGTGTNNSIRVIGSTGNDAVTAASGQIGIDGEILSLANVGQELFTPGVGSDSLSVNSGTLTLAPPTGAAGITAMIFSSIALQSDAYLVVQPPANSATRSVVVTSSLSLSQSAGSSNGTLDLSANDLIVRGGSLTTISSEIYSGLWAGGGTGITSSAALRDTTYLTTLGAIQNSVDGTATGSPLYSSTSALGEFDGINAASADVLVKYTYFGDTNLDGQVDGSDYSRLDNGDLYQLTGWSNGDINHDSIIDGSDYTLTDNAFNMQGVRLSAQAANAIPSPASIVRTKQLGMPIEISAPSRKLTPTHFFQTVTPIGVPSVHDGVEALLLSSDLLDRLASRR